MHGRFGRLCGRPASGSCGEPGNVNAIVSFHDDGFDPTKVTHLRAYRRQSHRAGQGKAYVFVLDVAIELAGWRFEYVGCRYAAGRNPPAPPIE